MTVQTLDLNMIPGGVLPVVKVSQYDFGLENLVFTLYDGDVAFSMPEDATVQIQGTKPDKNGFAYSCTYSNNVVTASIDQQMTVLAGQVPSEIVVFDDSNNRIASGNFILEVEEAAVSADTPISETDIPAIIELATQQLQTCIQKAQDASDSAGNAHTSETNAANSAGNAHTSETNAATSAGNAYTSETNAATSAGNAHTSETNAGNSATAAHNSEVAAKSSEDNAKDYMDDAHGWCDNKGDSGQNTYSATNNAYYWAQQAQNIKDTTPTENSVHAITSGAIFEIINDGVCPIETSTTATRAYAIGDYLQIANVTYKATAAITIGATLTTGTNIETVELGDEIKNVTQKVSDSGDVYDSTATYDVGDMCIYNNVLYKCNTAITTAEAFDPTKWTATTVSTELTAINTDLTEINADLTARTTWELIAQTSSTSAVQFDVDLSSYRYLMLILINGGNACAETTCPKDIAMGHWIIARYFASDANHNGVAMIESDTSIRMYSNLSNCVVYLYGME